MIKKFKSFWDEVIVPGVSGEFADAITRNKIADLTAQKLVQECSDGNIGGWTMSSGDPRENPFRIWASIKQTSSIDPIQLELKLEGTKLTMEIIDNEQTETYTLG